MADDADVDTIRRAFRQRAQELHPDLHPGDADAAEAMRAVNDAWAVLGDAALRADYDGALREQRDVRLANSAAKTALRGPSGFPQPLRIPVTVIILIVLGIIFVVTAYAGPR